MTEQDRYQQMLIMCKMGDMFNDSMARRLLRELNTSHIPNKIIRSIAATVEVWPTKEDGQRLKEAYQEYDRARGKRLRERKKNANKNTFDVASKTHTQPWRRVEMDSVTNADSTVFIISGNPCKLLGFGVVNGTTNAKLAMLGTGKEFCIDIVNLHDIKPMELKEFITKFNNL